MDRFTLNSESSLSMASSFCLCKSLNSVSYSFYISFFSFSSLLNDMFSYASFFSYSD